MKKSISFIFAIVILLQSALFTVSAESHPFTDIPSSAYYEDAVIWAVDNNITQGTSATKFSPKTVCDRAQAVTFLWRASGSPKVNKTESGFTDVPSSAYYFDAVLWAVENGITSGTGGNKFSPSMKCDRSQIVTFLWRSMGCPASEGNAPFADVSVDAYFRNAVIWAVNSGITSGTGNGYFSPYMKCDRSQIVTFLYRCFKNNAFELVSAPADYYMQSSNEDATFSVTVKGGEAPYYYNWYILYDNEEIPLQSIISDDTTNVISYEFSDYDFDSYRSIGAYCIITDSKGNKLETNMAEVFKYLPFSITSQPKDYNMSSSQEVASFTVSVQGGAAPYTYKWYVLRDNDIETVAPVDTNETSNVLEYTFSDYDFDDYRNIGVYCEIIDANGNTLESSLAEVFQH